MTDPSGHRPDLEREQRIVSETPRTDAVWGGAEAQSFPRSEYVVHLWFARQLERELIAAQATIAAQAEEIERLRDGLSGLLGLFHLLYERDDAPPWLREIALTNHRAQLARRLLMEPSNADRL